MIPSKGFQLKSQEFLSSGTWHRPAGVEWVEVELVSGGGSGAVGTNGAHVGGGAGGNLIKKRVRVTDDNITVTIGAGGAAKESVGNGNDGGATSFGSLSVPGGYKGRSDGEEATNPTLICNVWDYVLGGCGGAAGSDGGSAAGFGIGGAAGGATSGGGGGSRGNGTAGKYNGGNSTDAVANSGAGTGAVCAGDGTVYHSGTGGSGYCIVYWWE